MRADDEWVAFWFQVHLGLHQAPTRSTLAYRCINAAYKLKLRAKSIEK